MIIAGENKPLLMPTMTTEVLNEPKKLTKEESQDRTTDEVESSPVMDTAEQEDGEVSDASSAMANDEGEIVDQDGGVDEEQSVKPPSVKGEDDGDDEKKSALEKLRNMKFRTKSKVSVGSPVHERKDREKKEKQLPISVRITSPRRDNEEDRRLRKRRWEEHIPEERPSPRGSDVRQRSYVREPLSPASLRQSEPQKPVDNASTLRQRVEQVINITESEVTALSDTELRSMIARMCELEKEQLRILNGRLKQIETLHSFFKTAKDDVDRLFALIPPHMRPDMMHLPGYAGTVNRREESPASAMNGMAPQQINGAMRGMPLNNRPPMPGPFGPPHGMPHIPNMAPPPGMPPLPHNMLPPHGMPPPGIGSLSGLPPMAGMMPPHGMAPPSSSAPPGGPPMNSQAGNSVPGPSSSGADVRSGNGNVPSTSQPSQEQALNSRTSFPVAPSLLNRSQPTAFGSNHPPTESTQPSSSVPQSYLSMPPPSSNMPGHFGQPTGNVPATPYGQVANEGLTTASGLPNLSKPPPTFPGATAALPPNFSVPPPSSTAPSSSVISGTQSLAVTSASNLNVQTSLSTSHPPGTSSPTRNSRKSPIPATSSLPPVNLSVPPPMFNLPPPRAPGPFTTPPPNAGLPNLNRPPPVPQGTVPNLVPGAVPNMAMNIPPAMSLTSASLAAPPNLTRPPPNLSFPPPSIRPSTNLGNPRPTLPLNSSANTSIPPSNTLPRMTVPPPNITSMSVPPPPTTAGKKLQTVELPSGSSIGTSPGSFHSFASPSQQSSHFANRTPSHTGVNVEVRDASKLKTSEENNRLISVSDEEEVAK